MTTYTHWAEKIDSYEKFTEAVKKGYPSYRHDMHLANPHGSGYESKDAWFVTREMYREAAGIYPEPSTVLTALRSSYAGLGQYFVHISKDDPTMVAYTPDRTAGIADKQVRTTLGRFLRKYLLCPSDDWVAKQEAQHRSDLNGEFFEAKTVEEIEEVYTRMSGDSGCMRHTKQAFKLDYHPSAVYAAPGVSVAYLRNSSGDINARSVIYVNPNKPDDKRYVRIYGDQALASKLKRQGFRLAALEGVRLAMFPAGKGKNKNCYVMPYLDGPGGNRGSGKDCEAEYVVWPKGENYFIAISTATAQLLSNAGLPYHGARGTSGYIDAMQADMSALNVTCHFTGKTVNMLVGETAGQVLLEDGTKVFATPGAHLDSFTSKLNIYNGNTFVALCCTPETRAKFSFNGGYYPDDKTVSYFGNRRLSEKLYPDLSIGDRVVEKNSASQVTIEGETHWAKNLDVYIKITTVAIPGGFHHVKAKVFKSEIPELKKAGWVSVAPVGSVKTIAHKDNPSIVKLVNGKMACRQVHDIVPLAEGGWAPTRSVKGINIMSTSVYTLGDTTAVPIPVAEFRNWSYFKYDMRTATTIEGVKANLALHIQRNAVTNCRAMIQEVGGEVRVSSSYSINSYENLIRAATTISTMTDAQLMPLAYHRSFVRLYARAVLAIDAILQEKIQEAKYADAEANAVDYSLTPAQVLEQAARDIRNHPKPAPKPVNGKVSADDLVKWARTAGTTAIGPNVVVRTTSTAYDTF